LAWQQTHAWT